MIRRLLFIIFVVFLISGCAAETPSEIKEEIQETPEIQELGQTSVIKITNFGVRYKVEYNLDKNMELYIYDYWWSDEGEGNETQVIQLEESDYNELIDEVMMMNNNQEKYETQDEVKYFLIEIFENGAKSNEFKSASSPEALDKIFHKYLVQQ